MSFRSPFLTCLLAISGLTFSADAPKLEPKYPFRTGWANEHLPWYQLKPGEFPPHHSDKRISGELVQADFIHRTGQFRLNKTGELMSFSMPPFGAINFLNSEADLRDIPMGTYFLFFLNQDAEGNFTKLATMQDQFTMDAGHSFSYKLDEAKLSEGKLLVTKQSIAKKLPDLGKQELFVNEQTRVWKGDKQIKLADLAPGDELLFNRNAAKADKPSLCIDIWVGADTHKLATEKQRQKFAEFTKFRGLPGWIDKVEGSKLSVTLFSGDAQHFKDTYMEKVIVGNEVHVCVANDEIRTWNPPVDGERASIVEINKTSVDAYGTSGYQVVFTVGNMLEGFRKGRIVRLFPTGTTRKDQFYGESLMGYGFAGLRTSDLLENVAKEYPEQFPFRTDYSNAHLPWYNLEKGKTPPHFSEHVVLGQLLKVDESKHSGQFRKEGSDELVQFSLTDEGALIDVNIAKVGDSGPPRFQDQPATVRYLGGDATLSDIPSGTRCRFHLYQDDNGYFTRASLVSDEFSYLALQNVKHVVETLKLPEGKIHVTRRMPKVKDYNGDMQQPPDIARTELLVDSATKVWKGKDPAKLSDLALGDELLVNVSGEAPGKPSRCIEIWIGDATHQMVIEAHNKKPQAAKR